MATRRTTSTPAPKADPASAAKAPRRARRAKPKATAMAVTEDVRRAMIAEAAYFHAERRGFAPGDEEQDWLSAEAEIDALLRAAHLGGAQ